MSKLTDGLVTAGYSSASAGVIAEERWNWIIAEIASCETEIRKQEIIRFEFVDISTLSDNRCEKLTGEHFAGWELKTYERIVCLKAKLNALEAMLAEIK
jgi:hypothetical protein